MKKDILICGHRSFVATGLNDEIENQGFSYDCFSRGENGRKGCVVTGDVMNMSDNAYLDTYDIVINYIILKGQSVMDNLQYVASLLDFCKKHEVKHLIQISSISAYPNMAKYVNEQSEIENDWHNKGGYAGIKVAVDHYIEDNAGELKVTFVRPGFIYTKNHEISKTGLLISILGINILLGDKKAALPIVCREILHQAIIKLIKCENKPKVCLVLDSNKERGTKYNFIRHQWNVKPWALPCSSIIVCAKFLKSVGVFKEKHYQKVLGMFKRTWFDSSGTEKLLNISFGPRKIAVIGAGTYGSYVSNLLSLVYPHEDILLYDVGDEHLKDESEIGFLSHIRKAPYGGLQKGRFFGYGGASVKWGGQLLSFTDNDFYNPSQYLKGIVDIDKKYRRQVLKRFNLINDRPETRINENMFVKTGIWLSYFHRNLFKYFGIAKNDKINIVPYARVCRLFNEGNTITGFEFIKDGIRQTETADLYFLTSGAFESSRLLIESGLSREPEKMFFSDHLSQRAFKVKSGIKMGKEDFRFHVQGTSLVTKRFVGEIDGYSFYSQPICNEDFPFFKDLKQLLFGHKISFGLVGNILKNIPQCIAFAWYMIVLKKLYVYNNEFYLQIDIEAPRESGLLTPNEERDKYGERSVNVDFSILPQTGVLFTKARSLVKDYLDENGVVYEELPFSTSAEKYEDVYHPFGMFSDFSNIDDYFHRFNNMLVVNTGILPRAGGVNSTGVVLPMIEEYVNNVMR